MVRGKRNQARNDGGAATVELTSSLVGLKEQTAMAVWVLVKRGRRWYMTIHHGVGPVGTQEQPRSRGSRARHQRLRREHQDEVPEGATCPQPGGNSPVEVMVEGG